MVRAADEQLQLQELVARLSARYPTLPAATIAEFVQDQHSRFNGAHIREYVLLFVERHSHTALDELSVPYDSVVPAQTAASGGLA